MLFFIMLLMMISFQMFHTTLPKSPKVMSDTSKLQKSWTW